MSFIIDSIGYLTDFASLPVEVKVICGRFWHNTLSKYNVIKFNIGQNLMALRRNIYLNFREYFFVDVRFQLVLESNHMNQKSSRLRRAFERSNV